MGGDRIAAMKRARGHDNGAAGRRDAAEALAVAALGFLAAEPEQLGRFLESSGIAPDAIRDAARQAGFLAGVLDHFVADEPLLLAFAHQQQIDPAEVERARATLGGVWERDLP
jgi:hypothetical protein